VELTQRRCGITQRRAWVDDEGEVGKKKR